MYIYMSVYTCIHECVCIYEQVIDHVLYIIYDYYTYVISHTTIHEYMCLCIHYYCC